jgi:tetratricopeptide (TPR) repeat protein
MLMAMVALGLAVDVGAPAFHARVENAVVRGSREGLEAARADLKAAAPSPARSYTLGYVSWRLVSLIPHDDRESALAMLREAEGALRAVIAAEPSNAEAHALLSSVLGRSIGFQPTLGPTYGPKSREHLATAQRLDGGKSPRLPLLRGIRAFVVGAEFGGSLEKAEVELREAERLFDEGGAPTVWPSWGRPDVQAWLGQVLARKGDRDGARAAYTRALEMAPDYAYVKNVLLPALEKRGSR